MNRKLNTVSITESGRRCDIHFFDVSYGGEILFSTEIYLSSDVVVTPLIIKDFTNNLTRGHSSERVYYSGNKLVVSTLRLPDPGFVRSLCHYSGFAYDHNLPQHAEMLVHNFSRTCADNLNVSHTGRIDLADADQTSDLIEPLLDTVYDRVVIKATGGNIIVGKDTNGRYFAGHGEAVTSHGTFDWFCEAIASRPYAAITKLIYG